MALWVISLKYWWKSPIFKFFPFLLRGASGSSRLPLVRGSILNRYLFEMNIIHKYKNDKIIWKYQVVELGSQNGQNSILVNSPFWLPSFIMWQQWVSLLHFLFNMNIKLGNKNDNETHCCHMMELGCQNGEFTKIEFWPFWLPSSTTWYFQTILSFLN